MHRSKKTRHHLYRLSTWGIYVLAVLTVGCARCDAPDETTRENMKSGARDQDMRPDALDMKRDVIATTFDCAEPFAGEIKLSSELSDRLGASTARYIIDDEAATHGVELFDASSQTLGRVDFPVEATGFTLESADGKAFDVRVEGLPSLAPAEAALMTLSDAQGPLMRMRLSWVLAPTAPLRPERVDDFWLEVPAEFTTSSPAGRLHERDGSAWGVWPIMAGSRWFSFEDELDAWGASLDFGDRLDGLSDAPLRGAFEPEIAAVMVAHLRECRQRETVSEQRTRRSALEQCRATSRFLSGESGGCKSLDDNVSKGLSVVGYIASLVSFRELWKSGWRLGALDTSLFKSQNAANVFYNIRTAAIWEAGISGIGFAYDTLIFGVSNGAFASDGADPRVQTFDGLSYDFQAAGEFRQVVLLDDPEFVVHTRKTPRESEHCSGVAINQAVGLRFAGHDIVFDKHPNHPSLIIDGAPVESLEEGLTQVPEGASFYSGFGFHRFVWPDQREVEIRERSTWYNIEVALPDSYRGRVRGLMGDFNADPFNDLLGANEESISTVFTRDTLYGEFADAHRLSQDESFLYYADSEDTETYTQRDFPQSITSTDDLPPERYAQALEACTRAGVTHPTWLEGCIMDVGCTGEEEFIEWFQDRADPIVTAQITQTVPEFDGDVVMLKAPPSVLESDLESDLLAFFFEESVVSQDDAPIAVDFTGTGPIAGAAPDAVLTHDGSIRSYYIHLDPKFLTRSFRRIEITFSTPILGVSFTAPRLAETDAFFGASGTVYPMRGDRGLELEDGGDRLEISEDRARLTLELNEADALDGVRIFVADERHGNGGEP